MMPGVPVPKGAKIARPVELKLKAGWRYDPRRGVFRSDRGEAYAPGRELPRSARIVYKVPALLRAKRALSKPERELQRYVQVILPPAARPEDYVGVIARWPSVEEAGLGPEVSLPGGIASPPPTPSVPRDRRRR